MIRFAYSFLLKTCKMCFNFFLGYFRSAMLWGSSKMVQKSTILKPTILFSESGAANVHRQRSLLCTKQPACLIFRFNKKKKKKMEWTLGFCRTNEIYSWVPNTMWNSLYIVDYLYHCLLQTLHFGHSSVTRQLHADVHYTYTSHFCSLVAFISLPQKPYSNVKTNRIFCTFSFTVQCKVC